MITGGYEFFLTSAYHYITFVCKILAQKNLHSARARKSDKNYLKQIFRRFNIDSKRALKYDYKSTIVFRQENGDGLPISLGWYKVLPQGG